MGVAFLIYWQNGRDQNFTFRKLEKQETGEVEPYKLQIVWRNIAKFVILHGIFAYSTLYLSSLSWKMVLYVAGSTQFSGLGITMGAHRLWAHKTYKAKLPLRIFLTIANCMAGQNSIYIWSRDHRTHHKCSEKMGDPHNAKRGKLMITVIFACCWGIKKYNAM